MKRESKLHNIPFVHCHLAAFNDREHTKERLLSAEILQTAPIEGQRVPATFWKHKPLPNESYDQCTPDKDGYIYGAICGHRRLFTLRHLGEEKVVDPSTIKRDATTGAPIEGSGRPFSTIQAWVIEDATIEELKSVMNDNTGERLTEVEVCRKLMRTMSDVRTEQASLFACYGLLLQVYPPTGGDLVKFNKFVSELPIEATETRKQEMIREYHIGKVGGTGRLHSRYVVIKAAYNGATWTKDMYEDRLRGKQTWPSDADVKTLAKLYSEDVADRGIGGANAQGLVTPDNPGWRFLEKKDEILRAVEVAKAEGKNVKSTAMLTQAQIKERLDKSTSRSISLTLLFTLNKVPGSLFDDIMALQSSFEQGKIDHAAYTAGINKFYDKVAAANAAPPVNGGVDPAKLAEVVK